MVDHLQKSTFNFLKQLKQNNDRVWFLKHKEEYLSAMEDFTALVESIILKVSQFDASVLELDPKKCLFRIYRDTRFSKDKKPYKTNFGAHIAMGGKMSDNAGYYLHVQPEESFIGGGMYHPTPQRLQGVREKISAKGQQFKKIINQKSFKDTFELWGDQLKTCPKGFNKEDPMVEYLRYKDLVLLHSIPDSLLQENAFDVYCAKIFKKMVPFNNFLNTVKK